MLEKMEKNFEKRLEKVKEQKRSRYKRKVKKMLSTDETVEICPKMFRPKDGLSKIFLNLKKELENCRMEAYIDMETEKIVILFVVDNTLGDIFEYLGTTEEYKRFLKEWKVKK